MSFVVDFKVDWRNWMIGFAWDGPDQFTDQKVAVLAIGPFGILITWR